MWNDAAMFEGNLRFGVRAMLISAALFTGCGDDAPPMGSDAGSCAADSDCDDGLYCNGSETCSMGACVIGVAPCEADRCIFPDHSFGFEKFHRSELRSKAMEVSVRSCQAE